MRKLRFSCYRDLARVSTRPGTYFMLSFPYTTVDGMKKLVASSRMVSSRA